MALPFRQHLHIEDPVDLLSPEEMRWAEGVDNPWMQYVLDPDEAKIQEYFRELDEFIAREGFQDRRIRWSEKDTAFNPLFDLRLDVALYARAQGSAQKNGDLWNPLLDEFVERGFHASRVSEREGREKGYEYIGVSAPFQKQEKDLVEWIKNQDDPRSLEALLGYNSSALIEFFIAHAKKWDSRLLGKVLEHHPSYVGLLLENESIGPEQVREIVEWSLATLKEGPVQRGWAWRLDPVTYTLHGLRERCVEEMDEDILPRVVELVKDAPVEKDLERLNNDIEEVANLGWAKASVLLQTWSEDLSVEEMEKIYFVVRKIPRLALPFVKSPRATLGIWRDAAQGNLLPSIESFLINEPRARKDAVVREGLSSSNDGEILLSLMKEAKGNEFRDLFRKLGRGEPHLIEQAIRKYRVKILRHLEPLDLTPILSGADADLRMWATRTVGVLQQARVSREEGGSEKKTPTLPSPPRRRGR